MSTLPRSSTNLIFLDQCGRSVTSVGANDHEADGCESSRDFIAKYSIVKKELKETNYWLRLIGDTNPSLTDKVRPILSEGQELALIINAIIRNTKNSRRT